MIDADGLITAKFFESSLFLRANSDQLLRAALGEEIELTPVEDDPAEVSMRVSLDAASFGVGILQDLIVQFAVPDGQHLYGDPVPDGMVATTIEFDDDEGLVVRPPVMPPTTPHVLAGTGEELQIFEGDVVIRVPITHNGRSRERLEDGTHVIRIAGTVRWQACDDDVCHLPRSERFELTVPAAGVNSFERNREEGSTRMDFRKHFARMTERRT